MAFIRFVMVFSAGYIVAIALIYCCIQGFYLVKTIHELDPIMDKIDHELKAIDTKANMAKTSLSSSIVDLKHTLTKTMNLLHLIAPFYRRFKTANKFKQMERQINDLLQRIDGQHHK